MNLIAVRNFSGLTDRRLTQRRTAIADIPDQPNQKSKPAHPHWPFLHWLLGFGHHGQHSAHNDVPSINGREQFSYDDNDRLLMVTKGHKPTGQYHYDAMGNLLQWLESQSGNNQPSVQSYNDLNQTQSDQYDANGNLISDGQNTYAWDADNRLIQIKNQTTNAISTFVYDAYSRRISETHTDANGQSSTIYNLWCGEKLCAQANEQGQITQRYFSQGEWHNGQAYFYAQDQVGSVTAMIDSQSKMAGTALYSPYGKLLKSQGVQASIAYAGLYHHQESGLYLATYRAYNPDTARWLNRDPTEEHGGLNLYEYAAGNPVSFVDPLGLSVSKGIMTLAFESFRWMSSGDFSGCAVYNALKSGYDGNAYEISDALLEDSLSLLTLAGPGTFIRIANKLANVFRSLRVAEGGVDDFVKAIQGTVNNAKKGDIRALGGRERAKELFREFDAKGVGIEPRLRKEIVREL